MAGEKAGDPIAMANSFSEFEPSRETSIDMSLRSEANMTNCFKHRRRFFSRYPSVDCNILIAYWMMAGYLGPVDSVRRSYQAGHDILMKLTRGKILKPYASGQSEDINKVGLSRDSAINCEHQGFCDMENVGFFDLLELDLYPNVTHTNGMLKDGESSVLLIDGNHLSRQLFSFCSRLKCVACFNLMPEAVDLLLSDVENLSVLILRGCDFTSQQISLWFEDSSAPLTTSQGTSVMCDPPETREFTNLTVLEISGSAHLTDIPEAAFSKLDKLACIKLTELPISELPSNCFSRLTKRLRWLILRGCRKLQVLPSIRDLEKLEVLDISHCDSLDTTKSKQFKSSCLQVIDLSHTLLKKVPLLETKVLTHLFLTDSKISILSSVKGLNSLQVVDLSGAKNVATTEDLLHHHDLRVLDLSGTGIKSIDPISDKAQLRKLRLRDCKSLEKLPAMEKLESLEVFDVSGCENLTGSLDLVNLRKLKELNLSETNVVLLPLFAIHACLKLSLRRLRLDSLGTMGALTNLEDLDLNGAVDISSSGKLNIEFLRSLEKLQTLNLSNTSVQELPEMPSLRSLKELLLADCQHLKSTPGLKLLTKLETLDLSVQGEDHTEILFLSLPSSLQKLVLTNRYGVHKLFPLATPKLEILDVRGTDLAAIPYGTMGRMKCFRFPTKIDLTGVHLDKIGTLKEKLVKDDDNLYQPVEITIDRSIGSKCSMSAGANRFFHLQSNQGENAWEAFVYQFSVSELPKEGGDGVIHLQGDEFILINDHSWLRLSLNTQIKGRCVEIHGFPKDIPIQGTIQNSLKHADNVAFVGNDFSHSLSYLCPNAVEVCCVWGCPNMKTLLTGDATMAILAISHLVGLQSIFDETVTTENIKHLKCIHIDSCPLLTEAIPSSKAPENLTTLKIKFCGILSTLSKGSLVLSKLQNLVLFELPELEDTSAQLPNLAELSISRCGSLKNIDALVESARHSLEQLLLDSCPVIEHVFPSSGLPMKKLEVLKISSCSALATVFIETGSSSSSSLSLSSLSKLHLQDLKLWDLPNLRDIGGELSSESPPQLDPFLSQIIAHQVNHASMCHGNFPST